MSILKNDFFHNEFKPVFDVLKADKLKYGEIYTPLNLINNIFDLFEPDVFRDKEKKWLDPGAGKGYFSILLFKRLDEGLAPFFSSIEERQTHIIENMIYMSEIKKDNIISLRKTFGENANIFEGDFLSFPNNTTINNTTINNTTINNANKLTFNYVIGNPPYNLNGIKKVPTNTLINKKYDDGKTIWISFVKKSISLLKENGQLSMIIPSIWLKPDKARMYHYLMQYKIEKINCFTNTETNKLFNGQAQTPTCYFLLTKNTQATQATQATAEEKTISLFDTDKNKYIFFPCKNPEQPIPLFGSAVISKIIPFVYKYGSLPVHKTNLPSSKSIFGNNDNNTPYKNIKTCILDDELRTKPELVFNYSNIPQAYYGKPKIVLAHKMYGFPYIDKEGLYGISNRDNYVILPEEIPQTNKTNKTTNTTTKTKEEILLKLKDFLSTNLVLYIYEATRYRMKYLEKYAFEFIPNIICIPDFPQIINDETISAFFKLDEEDMEHINRLHKKKYKGF